MEKLAPELSKFFYYDSYQSNHIEKALQGKKLSGTSEIIEQYEDELSNYFNSKYAVALNSGSAALHAAMYALGVQEGDEVLLPGTATVPTILPVLTIKAKPVFVDIAKGKLGYDIEDLMKKITKKTKAAIELPLWGYPINYQNTIDILDSHKIPLIEDAAHAHGSKVDGKYVGTIGKIGCFSTHDHKVLATGEGGFILTDSEELAKKIRRFSQLGGLDGNEYGVNYKLNALSAALGSYRLTLLNKFLSDRRENAKKIKDQLNTDLLHEVYCDSSLIPNYYSLVLLPNSTISKEKFLANVENLGLFPDSKKYGSSLYKKTLFESKDVCLNSEDITKFSIQVPVHPGLTEKNIKTLIDIINYSAENARI